jgi:hypothetical protein
MPSPDGSGISTRKKKTENFLIFFRGEYSEQQEKAPQNR